MLTNFTIEANCALNYEGRYVDLHNNFDFVSFDYNVAEKQIRLRWKKSSGPWVNKDDISSVVLIHKDVDYLLVVEQAENSPYEEDSGIGEISFVPSTLRTLNDLIVPQSNPKEEDDILYLFENGQRIRVHCKQIELQVSF